MSLFKDIFTWWNAATIGTRLYTRRCGEKVGEDEMGNVFYRTRDGKRRWVIYAGEAEASNVPPDWHGWLHHTFDEPPPGGKLPRMDWEKDHKPNMTGSDAAYRPPGSILTPTRRPPAGGDYEAWNPE